MKERIPLLLIPGLASNRIMWEPQLEALRDIADCWVAPLPACDDLGLLAESILADSPDSFAVAGHSMGGYLCFEILRRAPQRVLRLALMSTIAGPESPTATERRLATVDDAERRGFLAMARDTIPRFLHPRRRNGGKVYETMVKQAFETGYEAYRKHQLAMIRPRDYRDLLSTISCPTMVMGGRDDVVTRPSGQVKLARLIRGATIDVIDGAAHMITLENPAQTNQAMRHWLTRSANALAA